MPYVVDRSWIYLNLEYLQSTLCSGSMPRTAFNDKWLHHYMLLVHELCTVWVATNKKRQPVSRQTISISVVNESA